MRGQRPAPYQPQARPDRLRIEEILELVNGETCLPNDRSQCSAVQFWMIRHHQLRNRIATTKDHVAAVLSPKQKTDGCKGFYALSPRDSRQVAHTATRMASNRSGGTGIESSSKLRMYPCIASRIFSIASSRVRPWLIQPGRLGHSATQQSSSPG